MWHAHNHTNVHGKGSLPTMTIIPCMKEFNTKLSWFIVAGSYMKRTPHHKVVGRSYIHNIYFTSLWWGLTSEVSTIPSMHCVRHSSAGPLIITASHPSPGSEWQNHIHYALLYSCHLSVRTVTNSPGSVGDHYNIARPHYDHFTQVRVYIYLKHHTH